MTKKIKYVDLKAGMIVRPLIEFYYSVYGSNPYKEQLAKVGVIIKVIKNSFYYGWEATMINGKAFTKVYTRLKDNEEYEIPSAAEIEEWNEQYEKNLKTNIKGSITRGNGLNVGSDPEIFIVDDHDVVIPAFDFLPSQVEANSRNNPSKPYWDGFQAEFNLNPTSCHAAIVDYYQNGLTAVLQAALRHNKTARLTYKSVLEVPYGIMKKASNKHAGLGCSPSLNAYGVEPLNIEEPRDLPLRFAGCHIHYGFVNPNDKEKFPLYVKTMDKIGGPIMTSMLEGLEDPRRRQFYGKAGEYRTPLHGLEYRVPSSTVLVHPVVTHLVLDLVRYGMNFAISGHPNLWKMPNSDERAQHILNDYDIEEARRNLRLNEHFLDQMIEVVYSVKADTVDQFQELPKKKFDKIKAIIMEGARNHLPVDMEKNWRIRRDPTKPLDEAAWIGHSDSPDASVVTMTF